MKDDLKINFDTFRKFICLHGVINMKNWDSDKMKKEFDIFISENWAVNLSMFSNKSY